MTHALDEEKNSIRNNQYQLRELSDALRSDQDFILELVSKEASWMQHASDALRGSRAFVLEAVRQDGGALKYASEVLQADRGFVLEAISISGLALVGASNELRADREVVLVAVRKNGNALAGASKALKADREVVLAAVKSYGYALVYASEEWQKDITLFDDAHISWHPLGESLRGSDFSLENLRYFMHQRLCHLCRLFRDSGYFSEWLTSILKPKDGDLDDASRLVVDQLSLQDAVRARQICNGGLSGLVHRGAMQSTKTTAKQQKMCTLEVSHDQQVTTTPR